MKYAIFICSLIYSCSPIIKINRANHTVESVEIETRKIMHTLKLPIRIPFSKEDSLKIVFDDAAINLTAQFHYSGIKCKVHNGILDTGSMTYIQPTIELSPSLYKIYNRIIDTSFKVSIKAEATIVHEFTHFLQASYADSATYVNPPDNFNDSFHLRRHYEQSTELQAYAVQSYYALSFINRKELKKIIRTKTDMNEKYRLLFNAYDHEFYPWRKPVF